MDKLGSYSVRYEKYIQEIMDRMELSDFADNSRLEPSYLIGYHHFMSYMYSNIEENNSMMEE